MGSDDIQRELDSLWERVTQGSPQPPQPPAGEPRYEPFDIQAMTREASLEAIAVSKRAHRAELARLEQYVELKDKSLRELTDRLASAEAELASLRRRVAGDEERIYREVSSAAIELESARDAAANEEQRYRQEEAVLREVAAQTRNQLAAEVSRWRELESQWNEREQRYLLDIREFQTRLQKSQEGASDKESKVRKSMEDLAQAKNAIEKTLAELLSERQEREAAAKERDKALKRVSEMEGHVLELQNLWSEERKQWQELWDRERSTWETRRKEFGDWEDKVRKERQEWHGQLKGLEGREIKYQEQMAEILRKSADSGEKITNLLSMAAMKAGDIMGPKFWRMPEIKKLAAVFAFAVLLGSLYPLWQYAHRLRIEPSASLALSQENPTGMAFDGKALWISEWDGTLSLLDPDAPSKLVLGGKVWKAGVYHPLSVAQFGEKLYSLDAAQSRILLHKASDPGGVVDQWPSPGPAPAALAHDGKNLWSYDAATKAVYKHMGDGKDAQTAIYKVDLDIALKAMAWFNEELWAYDAKGGRALILSERAKSFKLVDSVAIDVPLQAIALTYRAGEGGRQDLELWGVSDPAATSEPAALKKFRIRR